MSNTKWSKTALAQAVGVAVAGTTGMANAADALPSISYTSYKLDVHSDAFGGYYAPFDVTKANADSFKLTVPMQDNWDMGIGFSHTRLEDAGSVSSFVFGGYYGGIYTSSVSQKNDYETLDFEAGYSSTLGNNIKTRLAAGVRYIDLDQKFQADFSGAYGYSVMKYRASSDTKALGLHVGGQADMPIGNKGFSLSGGAGASLMYAEHKAQLESKYGSPVNDKSHDTVYGLDGEVAVNYHTKGGVTASVGYTYSKMYNFLQVSASDSRNLEQSGWFARIGTTFE